MTETSTNQTGSGGGPFRVSAILRWLTHPILVFVIIQIIWVAILTLWVIWFASQQATLQDLSRTLGQQNIDPAYGIVFLTLGCVLLGMILVGIVMLFVFVQRQSGLIRQQKNFVSSVTHELRSPLASIQLSFETLQKRELEPEQRSRLYDMVLKDVSRLVSLVDRILISSRLDRGLVQYHSPPSVVLVREVIDKVVEQTRHMDEALDERLNIECPPGLKIKIPAQALPILISNLLENAIKYSPAGSPILIKVEYDGDEVRIYVRDKGVGLNPKDLRKIFRMFYRSDMAHRRGVHGTGLGLFIIRSTARQLGGDIRAQSAGQGKGTTFILTLPRRYVPIIT